MAAESFRETTNAKRPEVAQLVGILTRNASEEITYDELRRPSGSTWLALRVSVREEGARREIGFKGRAVRDPSELCADFHLS
jgi:hypothetical protein